jgi:hypothetical protein
METHGLAMGRIAKGAICASSLIFFVVGGCATGSSINRPDSGTKTDGGGGNQEAGPSSCVVYPQSGCGANSTCEVDQQALDGSASCVAAGSKGVGQACTQTEGECAQGLTCVWNVCRPYCGNAGGNCTDPNTNACVNLTDSSSNPIPNLEVCRLDCALQDPNSCGGGGEGCIYVDTDQTDCYPVGTTTANCNASTSFCPAGQVCLTDQTNYFCLAWCRVGTNDCGSSATCNTLSLTVNGVEYGYCQ